MDSDLHIKSYHDTRQAAFGEKGKSDGFNVLVSRVFLGGSRVSNNIRFRMERQNQYTEPQQTEGTTFLRTCYNTTNTLCAEGDYYPKPAAATV